MFYAIFFKGYYLIQSNSPEISKPELGKPHIAFLFSVPWNHLSF